jgi:hypothetical protein
MIMKSPDDTLPEGHLEAREELRKREEARIGLSASINRYLDDGVREYSPSDLLQFGHQNWPVIKETLADWQSRGLVQILKPLEKSAPDDVVIKMLDYVGQKSPWPNWPPKLIVSN